jgi:hypothetical protein
MIKQYIKLNKSSLNTTYDVGNPGPGFRPARKFHAFILMYFIISLQSFVFKLLLFNFIYCFII